MNKIAAIFLSLILFTAISGCVPAALMVGATAGGSVIYDKRPFRVMMQDQNISQKARYRIQTDRSLYKKSNISVATYNHIVLLTGTANDEQQKQTAQELVQNLKHVKRVYNEIQIAGNSSLAGHGNDAWLTTKVKTKLLHDVGMRSTQLKIVSDNGNVYIMGLTSPNQCTRAAEIASHVAGVRKVVKVCEYNA